MNPVLQELLAQLQQRQIKFEDFKLDLLGLCKMSPGMVPAARLMVEGAIAQGAIPADAGYELIKKLTPAPQQSAKTLLRRDLPIEPTTATDATVLMDRSASSKDYADATEVMSKTNSALPADRTLIMDQLNRPGATDATAVLARSQPTSDATEVLNKPGTMPAQDRTVVINKPAAPIPSEPTAVIARPQPPNIDPPNIDPTVLTQQPKEAPAIERTVALQPATPTQADPTRIIEPRTAHRAPDPTTQRSAASDSALPVAEKTQRIAPPDVPASVADKTQRIDRSVPATGAEKTQRIEPNSPVNSSSRVVAEPSSVSELDFDLSERPEKTQRIGPSTMQPGTKQGQSHLGTMERMATDGPLPPRIDMGVVPFGPGTVIKERFLLKEQIGSGGMGVVYSAIDRRKTEARDPNPLVALKILGADFARHPKSLIALQREARKAQELAHPNVVTVFDFDREGDAVYMTMELLQGRSLDGFVREVRGKGVSREVAWPIIRGVAEGLAYAHKKGLVHSDLKPANIFLGDENVPKLLDFGIARAVPSRVSKESVKDIFDAGSLGAYTVPYATEEMVAGSDPHPADDIYALGLITYELLAGVHPYKRQGAPEARKLGMKPAPIKGLPRREWRTIERSISFNRADRPQDAAAFLQSLSGITKLQKALIAATAILATTAVFFAYTSYQEAGPEIAFSSLPAATQQQFNSYMADGDKLWSFYVKDKNILALQEAVEQYAAAYDLHPRNRDAVRALEKVADAALDATKSNPEQQREFAKSLIERSSFLAKDYPPLRPFVE